MKVLHTVSSLNSNSGGPSRSVTSLCEELGKLGVSIDIVTQYYRSDDGYDIIPNAEQVRTTFIKSNYLPFIGVPYYPIFRSKLVGLCQSQQIQLIHSNGLWTLMNHTSAKVAYQLGIPLITTLRGMLEPWCLNYHYWRKKIGLHLYALSNINLAYVLHATSKSEFNNLRSLGINKPVAIIPNGVNIPNHIKLEQGKTENQIKKALFLSRLHPIKGVLNLVTAWDKLRPINWHVQIIGPDENNYRKEVENAVYAAGLADTFEFIGPVDDINKWNYYQQADLFVLPSFSENFGIVVAEALASGVPVITTKSTPWEDLKTYKCGWWIDVGVDPLVAALSKAVSLTNEQRNIMGLNGKQLILQKYSWHKIAVDMKSVYNWILKLGDKPDCVVTD